LADNLLSAVLSLSVEEEVYAENNEVLWPEEIVGAEVWQGSRQDSCERNAAQETWDAKIWSGR
jgi:hypothetical protein